MRRSSHRSRRAGAGLVALVVVSFASVEGCGGAPSGGARDANSASSSENASDPAFREYAATHGIDTLNGGGGGPAPEVSADGLRLERVDPSKPVKLDGVLTEWPAMAKAETVVKGTAGKTALSIALMYDDAKIYVGADVTDPAFVAGRDHVSLVLAVPQVGGGYATYDMGLFAGKPGESEGSVRYGGRAAVPGAKIVEAPTANGYDFEASIPWGALPEARLTRVGIHGVARYDTPDTVIATGPGDARHPASMTWVPSEPELSMIEQLLAPKGLTKVAPAAEIVADLTGDGVRERVAVYEHYLTICGTSYLDGTGFFYRDLGGELVKVEVRDVTGRGREDVIVRRRASVGDGTREYLEVLSVFGAKEEPKLTFAHEIAVRQSDHQIDNSVRMAKGEIDVAVEPPTHWDAMTYNEPIATDVEPILLPWGGVRSQQFRWDGTHFAKAKIVTQKEQIPPGAPMAAAAHAAEGDSFPAHPPEPPTPKVTHGGDVSGELLATYKNDRGVAPSVTPKVDLAVQVAGDARPERVLLIGRDIVIFGPGFKGGTAYAYTTLGQFADASDIKDMSARDLTGDGAADIIVRGQRRLTSAKGAKPATADSDVMFVYTLENEALTRVFGIETEREQGSKRVQGMVQFVPSSDGKTFDILSAPGRATGWTKRTYPWAQEEPGSGDIEPLLLPWGGVSSVRYSWNGSAFVKGD